MRRSGFTMIELIFVIVILGILASVAIPKLSATRDDAEVSKAMTTVATLISDFGNHYTAKTTLDQNATNMTNVKLSNVVKVGTTGGTAELKVGTDDDCVKIATKVGGDMNLTKGTNNSVACKELWKTITITEYSFGGTGITR